MRLHSLKSKILATFIALIVTVTLLNVGLAAMIVNQQGEHEAYSTLSLQVDLLKADITHTMTDLQRVALDTCGDPTNLSSLTTIYLQLYDYAQDINPSAELERGIGFNKAISLNRLNVILRSSGFSSIAVYLDNNLSHYVTESETGMIVWRNNRLVNSRAGQNSDGKFDLGGFPNWGEGEPPQLIPMQIMVLDRPTLSFEFLSEQTAVLQIIVPIQATIHKFVRNNISISGSALESILVEDPGIATSAVTSGTDIADGQPRIIGAFVYKKKFDRAYLEAIAQKTGVLPAIYSADGIHQLQLVDLKTKPEELVHLVGNSSTSRASDTLQRIVSTENVSYYQALSLWQFEGKPSLILGFVLSREGTLQKIRETVSALVAVAFLILIIGGGLGYSLVDKFIKPIVHLTEAVSKIGNNTAVQANQGVSAFDSKKLEEISLLTNDEVGELTKAFLAMTDQLHISFETLEERVIDRTQRLETVASLSEHFNGILNAEELLPQVVEQIKASLNYYRVQIYLKDENGQYLVFVSRDGTHSEKLVSKAHPIHLDALMGLVRQTEQTGRITMASDLRIEPGCQQDPACPAACSEIAAPIILDDQVVGVLNVQQDQINGLDENDAHLLRTLANQIAVTIKNVRLFEQMKKALAETQSLYQVSRSLLNFENMPVLLQDTIDSVAKALPANRVSLILVDQETKSILHYYKGGPGAANISETPLEELQEGLFGWVTREQKPALSPKDIHDPRETSTVQQRRRETNCGSIIVVPLLVQGKFLGAMTSINNVEDKDFTARDADLMMGMASQVAVAIENAQLYEELQKARSHLERRVEERTVELKRIDMALRESESRYRGLFENSPISLWEEDFSKLKDYMDALMQQGIHDFNVFFREHTGEIRNIPRIDVLDVNQATLRLFMAHNKEEAQKSFDHVFSPVTLINITRDILSNPQGNQVFEDSIIYRRSTGEEMHFLLRWTVLPGNEQTLGRVILSVVDITESHKAIVAQQELEVLRKVDRVRSELISNVSHELRNPLGIILVTITALRDKTLQFDRTTRLNFQADIEEETRVLQKIVDNLLDATRLQGGELTLERQCIDLRQLISQVVKSQAKKSLHHHFIQELSATALYVMVDQQRIEQVLRNLLDNADKYSPPDTLITVHAELKNDEIQIMVTDEGPGVPIPYRERIFERFYRVQQQEVLSKPGLGLGLSICRGIVEAHKGRIWVEDGKEGGSSFIFTLPALKADRV